MYVYWIIKGATWTLKTFGFHLKIKVNESHVQFIPITMMMHFNR
jgi:hypothetical protein